MGAVLFSKQRLKKEYEDQHNLHQENSASCNEYWIRWKDLFPWMCIYVQPSDFQSLFNVSCVIGCIKHDLLISLCSVLFKHGDSMGIETWYLKNRLQSISRCILWLCYLYKIAFKNINLGSLSLVLFALKIHLSIVLEH